MLMKKQYVLPIIFFGMQLVLVTFGLFSKTKYYCWAPHTTMIKYNISCLVNGKPLSNLEIQKRYGFIDMGFEAHSIYNVIDCIQQTEQHLKQNVKVQLTHSKNGKPQPAWTLVK